ncbi:MAG: hypothetical protein GKS05_04515 [Nitrospirales bacterium]|nr:hypothetical protein [Nitrospirales bacterium]
MKEVDGMSQELRDLVSNIVVDFGQFHEALKHRAKELEAKGEDSDVVNKIIMGADAMKDSANIYLSWARHYIALSEGGASESEEGEEDSPDFGF